jgi:negative regulator of flagellin synthesis FlgM
MKIGQSDNKPVLNPAAGDRRAEAAKQPKVASEASGDASATVELSSQAAQLTAGASTADFDAAKVSRIAKAIATGQYKVNPEVVADKLIASTQELLQRDRTH